MPDLFLANDCLLFCKTTAASGILKTVLDSFCFASSQLINLHKSVLTFSRNASLTQKRLVTATFGIHQQDSVGKYLG